VVAKKPTPSPSPSPSPSLTADELDLKGAEAAAVAYQDLLDELSRNPDLERLDEAYLVARDVAAEGFRDDVAAYVRDQEREVGEVGLEILDSTKNTDGTWTVDTCMDLTDLDVLDKDGKSLVLPDREDRYVMHYIVSKDLKELKFYVVGWTNQGMEPC
jgi:hypothetical protein